MNKKIILLVILVLIAAAGFIAFRIFLGPGELTKDFDLQGDYSSEESVSMGTLEQLDNINNSEPKEPTVKTNGINEEYIEISSEIQITDGIRHLVPLDKIRSGGPAKDGIPSIDSPLFVSVAEADKYLDDKKIGIAVEKNGQWRFYPFQILVWHEIVNDVFADEPLLVTYCPLCGTGIVFDPRLNGERVEFGTSGRLFNSNLVMYDRKTDTLWSQQGGRAIVGKLTGSTLPVRSADNITWGEFKATHPEAEVLSRETGYARDYNRDPYGAYYKNSLLLFPVENKDDRLHEKTPIYGLAIEGQAKAYTEEALLRDQVVNDRFAGLSILVIVDPSSKAIRFYNRTLDSMTLKFEQRDGKLYDIQTNTEWGFDGLPIKGDLEGSWMERINPEFGFWFSWAAFNPESELYN